MYRKFLYLLFIACSFLLLQDCGDFKNNSDKVKSAVEITDRESNTSAPTILSTYPADSASSVAPNTSLTVTFSEAMDTSTITTNSLGPVVWEHFSCHLMHLVLVFRCFLPRQHLIQTIHILRSCFKSFL